MIVVPDGLVRVTTAREGAHGAAWVRTVPTVVAEVLARWDCVVDGDPTHGQVAVVVPVRQRGVPAVLKVSFPHPGNRSEPGALRAFDGHGAVRLLEADEDAFAMLLERAGPHTLAAVTSSEEAVEIAGDLARRLAVPAPAEVPMLAAMTEHWSQELDAQARAAPGALPPDVLDRARETIGALAADRTSTMLHGDLHAGNVLSADREPWLAIDPKGWRGTAAYDAFTVVASNPAELAAAPDLGRAMRERIHRFARAAGVDGSLAVACAQARATSSSLYERLHGGAPSAIALLEQAASLR